MAQPPDDQHLGRIFAPRTDLLLVLFISSSKLSPPLLSIPPLLRPPRHQQHPPQLIQQPPHNLTSLHVQTLPQPPLALLPLLRVHQQFVSIVAHPPQTGIQIGRDPKGIPMRFVRQHAIRGRSAGQGSAEGGYDAGVDRVEGGREEGVHEGGEGVGEEGSPEGEAAGRGGGGRRGGGVGGGTSVVGVGDSGSPAATAAVSRRSKGSVRHDPDVHHARQGFFPGTDSAAVQFFHAFHAVGLVVERLTNLTQFRRRRPGDDL
mmetsp:Transcript_1165/g.2664  ORF Transcript_1165/g.2664 Transcript_1165/m.2664 type:complete len:260 (-) Transcript_1165:919-1698(-)